MKTLDPKGCRGHVLISTVLATALNQGAAQAQESPASDGALEEVIVTAQKRSQNLQDVPIAVTALNADTLLESGGQNVQAVQGMVPNVEINTSNAATWTRRLRALNCP